MQLLKNGTALRDHPCAMFSASAQPSRNTEDVIATYRRRDAGARFATTVSD
jgi:hypothetical protein